MSPDSRGPTDGRARRWHGQRAGRRQEIVDAALRAIAEHGADTTIEHIADQAGVPRPGLYRHFDNRDDLDTAIAESVLGGYSSAMTTIWNPQGSPGEIVAAAITAHLTWLRANDAAYHYVLRVSAQAPISDLRDRVIDHLRGLLHDGLLGPPMTTDAADRLAAMIVGLVDTAARRWLEAPGPVSDAVVAAHIERAVLAVIAVAREH